MAPGSPPPLHRRPAAGGSRAAPAARRRRIVRCRMIPGMMACVMKAAVRRCRVGAARTESRAAGGRIVLIHWGGRREVVLARHDVPRIIRQRQMVRTPGPHPVPTIAEHRRGNSPRPAQLLAHKTCTSPSEGSG
ncbi:hypothetical protein C882_4580 [Caenispirillum salinarum AK4]|uniref:Uncharacterized protein n=1 Tax=Caenispirillum salinarum AK4 TaxID=1238182 RepID=K9GW55_9PROT|nr:hypothetical protein C882_4580 [Caenispirillum salinarum AK4]